jgi:hypothetical protein
MVESDYGIEVANMNKYAKLLLVIGLLLFSLNANAAWTGPAAVLSGSFGNSSDQFGVEYGDTSNTYSKLDGISSSGRILITDQVNHRIKVYKSDGSLLYIINSPAKRPAKWGITANFLADNIFANIDNYYLFSSDGSPISWDQVAQATDTGSILTRDGKLFIQETAPTDQWLIYSSVGQLLSTSKGRPLDLGNVNDEVFVYQDQKMHRVTIKYPDATFVTVNKYGACDENNYIRDSSGNIYCQVDRGITRYSACGKGIADFVLPENQDLASEPSSVYEAAGAEDVTQVTLAYADLLVAGNGDLYASKVTQDSYSVVHWAWTSSSSDPVGGPDAPVQLEGASDTTGSVMLKWVYSLQDPGCVTGYEVGRATTAGGPYIAVGTVQPGDINKGYSYHDTTGKSGTTYYYAVRAVSAIGDSPYSNEVSVTVK